MPSITDSPFKFISILYRKSHIWFNDGCKQFELTASQAAIILIVCDYKVLTQEGITKRLSLDKSVIAKTVTKLEEMGFLERTVNVTDRRTFDIHPTQKARDVYPFAKEQMDVCFDRMTRHMTDAERKEFIRLLLLAAESSITHDE